MRGGSAKLKKLTTSEAKEKRSGQVQGSRKVGKKER